MSFVDLVNPYLPKLPGLLPKWLLFISVVSVFNSAQTYSGIELTQKVYEGKPHQVTELSARTFGTWTLVSCIIRGYAAYYLNDSHVYDLAIASYLIALLHFGSEWLIYKTVKFGRGLAGPLVVSTLSLVWLSSQRDYYLSL